MPVIRRSARLQSLTKDGRPKSSMMPNENLKAGAPSNSQDDRQTEVLGRISVTVPEVGKVAAKVEPPTDPDFALAAVEDESLSQSSSEDLLEEAHQMRAALLRQQLEDIIAGSVNGTH